MERELHSPPVAQPPVLPTSEQLLNWPAERDQLLYHQEQLRLEQQLADLESQATELRARLASGDIMPQDPQAEYRKLRQEHNLTVRTTVMDSLDALEIPDGTSETAPYSIHHDLDMAGSYDEDRLVAITHSDGAYYITNHAFYDTSARVTGRTIPSRSKLLALHRQLQKPMEAEDTTNPSVSDLQPSEWSYIEGDVQQAVEALAKNRIVEGVLAILGDKDDPTLQVSTARYGDQQYTRTIPFEGNISATVTASYWPEQRHLHAVWLQLFVAGERTEAYSLEVSSLELESSDWESDWEIDAHKRVYRRALALFGAIQARMG